MQAFTREALLGRGLLTRRRMMHRLGLEDASTGLSCQCRSRAWRGYAASAVLCALANAATMPVPLAAQQAHLERIGVRVGTIEGPGVTFGEVSDASAVPSGVVVLDARLNTLQLIDRKGRVSDTLARAGNGPGELVRPRAITANSAGLFVLDPAAGRFLVFQYREGMPAYRRQIAVRFTAFDLCSTGTAVVLLGTYRGRVLHALPIEGGAIQSFGDPWGPPHPLLERSLSRGFVACSQESDVILAVSSLVPEMRAYRTDGRLLWKRGIPEFKPVVIRPNRDGSVTYGTDAEEYHDIVVGASVIGDGYFLVQYGRLGAGATGTYDVTDPKAVVVSADGVVGPVQRGLPRVLSARDGTALTAQEDPFPMLEVFRIDVSAGVRK